MGNEFQRRQGSGFTNLNRILDANKSNKIGQTVQTGVQNLANQAKQQTQAAVSGFNDQSQQYKTNLKDTEQFANQAIDKIKTGEVSGVNEQDQSKLGQVLQGQYTGPQGLNQDQVAKTRNAANQAEQYSKMGSTMGGRSLLLDRFVNARGKTGYTQGGKTLDATLLSKGNANFGQMKQAGRGLIQDVNKQEQVAQSQAQVNANQARQVADQTKAGLTSTMKDVDTSLAGRLKEEQDKNADLLNTVNNIQTPWEALKQNQGETVEDFTKRKDQAKADYNTQVAKFGGQSEPEDAMMMLKTAYDKGLVDDSQISTLLGGGLTAKDLGLVAGLYGRNETFRRGLGENAGRDEYNADLLAGNIDREGLSDAGKAVYDQYNANKNRLRVGDSNGLLAEIQRDKTYRTDQKFEGPSGFGTVGEFLSQLKGDPGREGRIGSMRDVIVDPNGNEVTGNPIVKQDPTTYRPSGSRGNPTQIEVPGKSYIEKPVLDAQGKPIVTVDPYSGKPTPKTEKVYVTKEKEVTGDQLTRGGPWFNVTNEGFRESQSKLNDLISKGYIPKIGNAGLTDALRNAMQLQEAKNLSKQGLASDTQAQQMSILNKILGNKEAAKQFDDRQKFESSKVDLSSLFKQLDNKGK
jgi:hypothetical protein